MEKGVPIRSLSRGISVLQAVNRGGSLSMMEIAKSSEVPYPTACRIVQTLLYEGLIEREPSRKRYRPTALVQTLAHGFEGHARLVQVARSHIVELTRQVGWPVSLATHVGHSMVVRDSTHSLSALTFNEYFPGFSLPILECASGIAYLAHIADDERARLIGALKLLPNKISANIIYVIENDTLIEDVQRQGYATRGRNQFTRNPGKTSSIAVPIFEGDQVAGTLALAFFASAIKMSDAIAQFVDPLKATARAIGKDLTSPTATPDASGATVEPG